MRVGLLDAGVWRLAGRALPDRHERLRVQFFSAADREAPVGRIGSFGWHVDRRAVRGGGGRHDHNRRAFRSDGRAATARGGVRRAGRRGLAASSFTGSRQWLALAALCVGAVGLYSATPPFWSLPTAFLRGAGCGRRHRADQLGRQSRRVCRSVCRWDGCKAHRAISGLGCASSRERHLFRLLVLTVARSGQVSTTVRTQTTCSKGRPEGRPLRNFATARRTSNVERRTPNAERRTSNVERRTSNVERRTSNLYTFKFLEIRPYR